MTTNPIPRLVRQRLILRTQHAILFQMARQGLAFEQVAYRLGTTVEEVQAWLQPDVEDMNLDTISDLAFAIGCELRMRFEEVEEDDSENPTARSAA